MTEKEKKNNGNKKPSSWKRVALIVLCVVLALILALLIFGTVYWEIMLGKINHVDPSAATLSSDDIASIENGDNSDSDLDITAPTIDPDDIVWGDEPDVVIGDTKEIINILLIGQDARPGETIARSDSMILCTINTSTKSLTMTSFMRDMYLQIPGYQDNRINASYSLGGMTLLDSCLSANFGVHVDGNIEVDFSGFEKIIDLMGGVEINLTSNEAWYLNQKGNWSSGEVYNHDWKLVEGVNCLTGPQALAYSRIRGLDNDFVRTGRQRTVLNALLEKCKSLSLTQINTLLNEILPLITTDMTDTEITGYVMELFPMLPSLTVTSQRIPADNTWQYATIRGMSVILPDLEANRKVLIDTIGGE